MKIGTVGLWFWFGIKNNFPADRTDLRGWVNEELMDIESPFEGGVPRIGTGDVPSGQP